MSSDQSYEILSNPELKMLYDMGGMEAVRDYNKEEAGGGSGGGMLDMFFGEANRRNQRTSLDFSRRHSAHPLDGRQQMVLSFMQVAEAVAAETLRKAQMLRSNSRYRWRTCITVARYKAPNGPQRPPHRFFFPSVADGEVFIQPYAVTSLCKLV
eukprot:SAG11_NODE_4266_length_1979_cov_1.548936_3_plen_154_part_00